MAYQQSCYPVIATLTPKNGVFLVCEPKGSTSEVSCKRENLERKLSSSVLQAILEAEPSSCQAVDTAFSLNELVAVSTSHIKYWQRGLIKNKCGKSWEILLVDWGTTAEVFAKDVQSLPQQFKAVPYFSRQAKLDGIRPVTLKIDHSAANGPMLTQCLTEEFDEATLEFIQDRLYGSSETSMEVIAEDKNYLHIRLFLKPKGMDSLFCLNEELCKEGYAIHSNSKRANQAITQLDEASCTAPPISPRENPNAFDVGFSDYARNYEKKKKEKEMLALQATADLGKATQSNGSRSPSGMRNVAASRTISKSPKTMSFGRGKLLAMKDEDDINLSSSRSPCDAVRTFYERSYSSLGSRKYESDRSTDFSFSFDEETSNHDLSHTNAMKLNRVSSPYCEESFQTDKLNANDRSFGSDVSGRKSVSLGRGRKLLELLSQPPKQAHGIPAASEASIIPSKEFVLAQEILQRSRIQQVTNERLHAGNLSRGKAQIRPDVKSTQQKSPMPQVSAHPAEPPSHDLSCYPAGMPINQIAKKPQVNLPSQRERPIPAATEARTSIKPKTEYAAKLQNNKFNLSRLLQSETSISGGSQSIKNEATKVESPSGNVKRCSNSRTEILKAALFKSKTGARHQVAQAEDSTVILDSCRPEDTLQLREMDFAIPVTPERECAVMPSYSDVDAEELQNAMELMELVSGKSTGFSPKKGNCENFRLSLFGDFLKEGRVLVRTPGKFTPSRDLYDIPFERVIHEALGKNNMKQPKILQAYVWKAMLDLSHVAYVAGSKTGKTYGYLVPILNSLLDDDLYTDIPKGCSPRAIIICPTWESAYSVGAYARKLVNGKLMCGSLEDASQQSIQTAIPSLINGFSVLSVTALALLSLLEEAQNVINFDRCCHLVFEDADMLLRYHGKAVSKIFERYAESVQRVRSDPKTSHMPRQIVACASHWSDGMKTLAKKVLQRPSIFISSCVEAAIYGRMKMHLIRGTKEEMKATLLKTVSDHRREKIVIFCRDPEEIDEVKHLLLTINAYAITAHGQSVIPDLNHITSRWENASVGGAILLCTDDILNRLGIQDAKVLIHYFIPSQSKYNFTYRLSFAMGNFHPENPENQRPESFILMTEEFESSFLGIIRMLERFGYRITDELRTKAILSYCFKQADRKDIPLCNDVKILAECPDALLCTNRHIILKDLDQPVLPFKNGMVRIGITAVLSATHYYARILKYCGQDKKVIDMTKPGLELEAGIRSHFKKEAESSVNPSKVTVGQIYALKSVEGFYERIRVKAVGEKNQLGIPTEAFVFLLDKGNEKECRISDLFHLPDHLKAIPQQAIEIILAGLKPPYKDRSWLQRTVKFVEEKMQIRKGEFKEFDGRIVLALSSTLWLQPLHERRKVEGTSALVIVTDIYKELLDTLQAEKNDDHIKKLYTLCETGGIPLSDYSCGIAHKKVDEPDVQHAFLPLLKKTEVQMPCFSSPDQFYVCMVGFRKLVNELETDVLKEIGKCKGLIPEEAKPGKICLAHFSGRNMDVWYRSYIRSQMSELGERKYQVFYVDHGFSAIVRLEDLKVLPKRFAERLPFQAISCSLSGVKPINEVWLEESIDFANVCLESSNESQLSVVVEPLKKSENTDPATNAPVYSVKLTIPGDKEKNECDLATLLIASNYAIPAKDETSDSTSGQCERSQVEREEITETLANNGGKLAKTVNLEEIQDSEEERDAFYVSPGWYDFIMSNQDSQDSSFVQRNVDAKYEEVANISPIDSLENTQEDAERDNQEGNMVSDIIDVAGPVEMSTNNGSPEDDELATTDNQQESNISVSTDNREDSERTSTLIEHIVPLKSADSCFPSTKWYQNNDQVNVTFEVGEVDKYEVDISPNCFSFATTVKEQRYELKTNTYGSVIPVRSSHEKISSGVLLRLQKRNVGEEWIRLMQSPYRPDWLRRDFSRICEFFSDSDGEDGNQAPLVDPKYAFEVDQDSTGSDSSDPDEFDHSDFEEM